MKYYRFLPSQERVYYAFDIKGGGGKYLELFESRLRASDPIPEWPEIEIILQPFDDNEGDVAGSDLIPDVGTCYGESIYSEKFREKLGGYFTPYGEFLPLKFRDSIYYFFHVTNFISALDKEKSEFSCFSNGEIMVMMSLVLRKEVLNGNEIFRLNEDPVDIYLSEKYKDLIESSDILGALFEEVALA